MSAYARGAGDSDDGLVSDDGRSVHLGAVDAFGGGRTGRAQMRQPPDAATLRSLSPSSARAVAAASAAVAAFAAPAFAPHRSMAFDTHSIAADREYISPPGTHQHAFQQPPESNAHANASTRNHFQPESPQRAHDQRQYAPFSPTGAHLRGGAAAAAAAAAWSQPSAANVAAVGTQGYRFAHPRDRDFFEESDKLAAALEKQADDGAKPGGRFAAWHFAASNVALFVAALALLAFCASLMAAGGGASGVRGLVGAGAGSVGTGGAQIELHLQSAAHSGGTPALHASANLAAAFGFDATQSHSSSSSSRSHARSLKSVAADEATSVASSTLASSSSASDLHSDAATATASPLSTEVPHGPSPSMSAVSTLPTSAHQSSASTASVNSGPASVSTATPRDTAAAAATALSSPSSSLPVSSSPSTPPRVLHPHPSAPVDPLLHGLDLMATMTVHHKPNAGAESNEKISAHADGKTSATRVDDDLMGLDDDGMGRSRSDDGSTHSDQTHMTDHTDPIHPNHDPSHETSQPKSDPSPEANHPSRDPGRVDDPRGGAHDDDEGLGLRLSSEGADLGNPLLDAATLKTSTAKPHDQRTHVAAIPRDPHAPSNAPAHRGPAWLSPTVDPATIKLHFAPDPKDPNLHLHADALLDGEPLSVLLPQPPTHAPAPKRASDHDADVPNFVGHIASSTPSPSSARRPATDHASLSDPASADSHSRSTRADKDRAHDAHSAAFADAFDASTDSDALSSASSSSSSSASFVSVGSLSVSQPHRIPAVALRPLVLAMLAVALALVAASACALCAIPAHRTRALQKCLGPLCFSSSSTSTGGGTSTGTGGTSKEWRGTALHSLLMLAGATATLAALLAVCFYFEPLRAFLGSVWAAAAAQRSSANDGGNASSKSESSGNSGGFAFGDSQRKMAMILLLWQLVSVVYAAYGNLFSSLSFNSAASSSSSVAKDADAKQAERSESHAPINVGTFNITHVGGGGGSDASAAAAAATVADSGAAEARIVPAQLRLTSYLLIVVGSIVLALNAWMIWMLTLESIQDDGTMERASGGAGHHADRSRWPFISACVGACLAVACAAYGMVVSCQAPQSKDRNPTLIAAFERSLLLCGALCFVLLVAGFAFAMYQPGSGGSSTSGGDAGSDAESRGDSLDALRWATVQSNAVCGIALVALFVWAHAAFRAWLHHCELVCRFLAMSQHRTGMRM